MLSFLQNAHQWIRTAAFVLAVWLVILPSAGVYPGRAAAQPENQAARQGSAWSEPERMGLGWFSDIAADASGGVHLVWSSSRTSPSANRATLSTQVPDAYDIVNYAAFSQDEGWSSGVDILAALQTAGSEVTRPNALIDSTGKFHLTFRDTTVYYASAPVQIAASSRSWSEWYPLSVDQVAYFSDLALDSKGVMHAIYTENVISSTCSICYHVYYRFSTDQGATWSARTDVSTGPTGAAKPHLLVDDQDNLHVVWEAGSGGSYGQLSGPTSVMYAASYDGGEKWSRPAEFIVPGGQGRNIAIGMDGDGNLLVVWLALPEDQVVYQVSTNYGRTWTDPTPIPGIWSGWASYSARLDDYDMETDSAGNLHLVLVGRSTQEQRELDLLHLTWNKDSWRDPEVITTYVGDVPEWPRLAIALGNQMHVTWFVRDEARIYDSDRGGSSYAVWTSYRRISAPGLIPQTIPTPAPTVTPVVEQVTVLQTPTLTPPDPAIAAAPASPDVSASLYTELDEMQVMAMALLPTLAFVLLVMVFVRNSRRR